MPQAPGVPDHAAPATGLLASLPGRTIVQGVLIDVLLAICFVVYDSLNDSAHTVNWAVLGALVLKTGLMTVASSIMKRLKPPPAGA